MAVVVGVVDDAIVVSVASAGGRCPVVVAPRRSRRSAKEVRCLGSEVAFTRVDAGTG